MIERLDSLGFVPRHARDFLLSFGREITAGYWQGTNMFEKEKMIEVVNYAVTAPLPETAFELAEQTKANREWAEEHFRERISGLPLNPGESYQRWPYNVFKKEADPFLKNGKFSHTYMERIWPKFANNPGDNPRQGIRYQYGDLADLIALFGDNPFTRQAYLPIFFPEDTGAVHKERIPCTLGYNFIFRQGKMHVNYYIRSCDIYRHFRNDLYLTGRLAQYISEELNLRYGVKSVPGDLTIIATSLHAFRNDLYHIARADF